MTVDSVTLSALPRRGNWIELPFAMPAFFSTRTAGDMGRSFETENANRIAALGDVGLTASDVVWVKQEHTRDVMYVSERNAGLKSSDTVRSPVVADGVLLSGKTEYRAAGVTVADCLPIYVHNKRDGVTGVLHSGWKGTGILDRALEILGADTDVLFGPCIARLCYAVPVERAMAFASEWGDECVENRGGRWFLDIRRANLRIAERRGVRSVCVVSDCTHCNPELWSYRRDGRMGYGLAVAVVRKDDRQR